MEEGFRSSCFNFQLHYLIQIAYSLIEEQEGRTKLPDNYISFVSLLADSRYCGIIFKSWYLLAIIHFFIMEIYAFYFLNPSNKMTYTHSSIN